MTSEYLFEFVKEKEGCAVAAQVDGQGRRWTSSELPARSL
jgi:GH24 family phage-related lysozyme (muramidase)